MKYKLFMQDFSKELFLVPAPADHPLTRLYSVVILVPVVKIKS